MRMMWRVAAAVVFTLTGVTAVMLTASAQPEIHRLVLSWSVPDSTGAHYVPHNPDSIVWFDNLLNPVTVAAVILAAGSVALLLPRASLPSRLVPSGLTAGTAVYSLFGAEAWMVEAVPGALTIALVTVMVQLGVLSVLLALPPSLELSPGGARWAAVAAVAVGGVVLALTWWRAYVSGNHIVTILVEPLVLSGVVVACALVAGIRSTPAARWAFAGIAVLLPVVALVGQLMGMVGLTITVHLVGIGTAPWGAAGAAGAGPFVGAALGALLLLSRLSGANPPSPALR